MKLAAICVTYKRPKELAAKVGGIMLDHELAICRFIRGTPVAPYDIGVGSKKQNRTQASAPCSQRPLGRRIGLQLEHIRAVPVLTSHLRELDAEGDAVLQCSRLSDWIGSGRTTNGKSTSGKRPAQSRGCCPNRNRHELSRERGDA